MVTYYGLMDIGSNTIHAVVYAWDGQKKKKVASKKEFAGLIQYVEGGILNEEGAARLCNAVQQLSLLFCSYQCEEVLYFATAVLRVIENLKEILQQVKKQTGKEIVVISGQDEAYYDFISLQNCSKRPCALGLDLGGGSGQVFYYTQNALEASSSYPIGCLYLSTQYVSGILPTLKERSEIRNQVKVQLKNGPDFCCLGIDTLYVMGGTGRACLLLAENLQDVSVRKAKACLTIGQLRDLLELIQESEEVLMQLLPERLYTIVPGLLAILTVAEYVGVTKVNIIKEGVREGILLSLVKKV